MEIKRVVGIIKKIDSAGRISIPKSFRDIVPLNYFEVTLVQDKNDNYTIELKPIQNNKER